MSALTRGSIGKLGFDYPGFIAICKLRCNYGNQEYKEELGILHSWYSDLNAYLPVMYKGKEKEYSEKRFSFEGFGNVSLSGLMQLVSKDIDTAYQKYDPLWEGPSLDPEERQFIKLLRAIHEQLDIITAESGVIKGIKLDEEAFNV